MLEFTHEALADVEASYHIFSVCSRAIDIGTWRPI